MTNSILQTQGLGKVYSKQERLPVRENFRNLFRLLFGQNPSLAKMIDSEIIALHPVNIELSRGETLGIIGPNGSGKTTLMKILAGILAPSFGKLSCSGTIQALIALGAGFDDKLSGQENIRIGLKLRGGFSPTESDIEEVLNFAELDHARNMPVSTYSSGMKARLGFSLNVYLKPDILIVDEALSVGDEHFKLKCKTKLVSMKKDGVSIIIVSHSMNTILQFCDRVLWLEHGKVQMEGAPIDITQKYLERVGKLKNKQTKKAQNTDGSYEQSIYGHYVKTAQIKNLQVSVSPKAPTLGKKFYINVSFELPNLTEQLNCSLVFYREDGLHMTTISTLNHKNVVLSKIGKVNYSAEIKSLLLNPGQYVLIAAIHSGNAYLVRKKVAEFNVKHSLKRLNWGLVTLDVEVK